MLIVLFPLAMTLGWVQTDTIRARLLARIGENSSSPFLIGEISGIALDDSGRVYLADFQDPRVLVFTKQGRHLVTIGRRGRGPGEFSAPTGPVLGPDDALYVRNMEQVMRFIPDSTTSLPSVFDRTFEGPAMAPWRSKLPSVIDGAGRFHFPLEVGLRDGLTHYAYRRYLLTGERLDSIAVPIYHTTRSAWASHAGRMFLGVSAVPFHPNPAWAISPVGTVVSGPADRYELSETDSVGRVRRRISRTATPVRIPRRERAESLQALRTRLDSLPVAVGQVRGVSEEVREQRLPASYPAYRDILIVPSGEIWVRRWSPPPLATTTILDVLDPDGAYLHTVILPVNCTVQPPLAVRGDVVACVEVDLSGSESAVIALLPKLAGRR